MLRYHGLFKFADHATKTTLCNNLDSLVGPKGVFEILTLEELGGLPFATTSIRGGESEALKRLAAFYEDAERVATFSKPKTSPGL